MNIILIGMRGTGKTCLGKIIARKLGKTFFDLDQIIENKTGEKIDEIVSRKGWEVFRGLEKEAVREVSQKNNCVISTGGGAVIDQENAELLKANGKIVLLFADVNLISERLRTSFSRPSLVKGKTSLEELKDLWNDRKEIYYNMADISYDSSLESLDIDSDLDIKSSEIISILKENKFI